MFDRFVLKLPFRFEVDGSPFAVPDAEYKTSIIDLKKLQKMVSLKLAGTIEDGEVFDLRHPYESIPSSWSGLVFKIFDSGQNNLAHVELKASPAKLLQGHNVYGSECPEVGIMSMLVVFFNAYPDFKPLLNVDNAEITSLDSTYSCVLKSNTYVLQVLDFLGSVTNGQTKARESYVSTVYWGKADSRHRRLKAYSKFQEVQHQIAELQRKNHNNKHAKTIRSLESVLAYSMNLLRFEATAMKRWLLDRGIPIGIKSFVEHARKFQAENGYPICRYIWQECFNPIFQALGGHTMKIHNDVELKEELITRFSTINKQGKLNKNQALAAFRTFRNIKAEGWIECQGSMSSSTFYRHVSMISACGLSKAYLQNCHKADSNVIPFIQYVQIDFEKQKPDNYNELCLQDVWALAS